MDTSSVPPADHADPVDEALGLMDRIAAAADGALEEGHPPDP